MRIYHFDTFSTPPINDFSSAIQTFALLPVSLPPQILAGLIQDLDSPARALSIEASRRLGSNWKLYLQAWGFLDSPTDDLLFNVGDDDFLQVDLAYYF